MSLHTELNEAIGLYKSKIDATGNNDSCLIFSHQTSHKTWMYVCDLNTIGQMETASLGLSMKSDLTLIDAEIMNGIRSFIFFSRIISRCVVVKKGEYETLEDGSLRLIVNRNLNVRKARRVL